MCNYLLEKNIRLIDFISLSGIICILFFLGKLSLILSGRTKLSEEIHNSFINLQKPRWSPSGITIKKNFHILYFFQGLSVWIILLHDNISFLSIQILLFIFQLFLYFLWPILFFKYKLIGLAAINAIILWISIDYAIYLFWKINPLASFILYPYLCWITITTFLSITIWQFNRKNLLFHHDNE